MKPEPVPGPDAAAMTLEDLSFLSCLDRAPLGETWLVRTRGGKQHLCQFLPPTDPEAAAPLLERLNSFRHRTLAPWMLVRGEGNRLALLSLLEGKMLRDRFQEVWDAKQPGISRDELIGYLRPIATALDSLQTRHQVQHLWLHPRQIMLQDERALVLHFGLAETWWPPLNQPTAELNPRYSAPELQRKVHGPGCDQYSLALIYAEMLSGQHPWRGRGTTADVRNPDLGLLPDNDRVVIQRALDADPRARFGSMTDMMDALEEAGQQIIPSPPLQLLLSNLQVATGHPCQSLDQFVSELVQLASGKAKVPDELKVRFSLKPGRHLELPGYMGRAEDALPLFDGFCKQWHAKTVIQPDGLIIFVINAEPSVWKWLEIHLRFLPVSWGTHRSEVVVRPFGCTQEKAESLLKELGPRLLQSVREILHAQPDQRGRERLSVRERLRVSPVVNGAAAPPIECYTKDISAGGIGFYLPVELPASEIYVSLPEVNKLAPYSALAQVVRKKRNDDGWFEIGASFPVSGK
jgi:hypothetical protein